MATYIAQRKESFFGNPIDIEWISQCGVSILTNQKVLCESFNYFGIHSHSLFDAVTKLSFTLRLTSWQFKHSSFTSRLQASLARASQVGSVFRQVLPQCFDSLMTFESMLTGSQPLFTLPHLALLLNLFGGLLMWFFFWKSFFMKNMIEY
jgi:hypothetical protein